MLEKYLVVPLLAVLVLAISGCASAPTVKAEATPGGAAIEMKAGNFSFDPNLISIHGTGTITVTITNGGTGHNITVKDPEGKVIDNVEIPPNGTVSTQITFPAPGDYYFFCNHPLHEGFGMKGHFVVSGS